MSPTFTRFPERMPNAWILPLSRNEQPAAEDRRLLRFMGPAWPGLACAPKMDVSPAWHSASGSGTMISLVARHTPRGIDRDSPQVVPSRCADLALPVTRLRAKKRCVSRERSTSDTPAPSGRSFRCASAPDSTPRPGSKKLLERWPKSVSRDVKPIHGAFKESLFDAITAGCRGRTTVPDPGRDRTHARRVS